MRSSSKKINFWRANLKKWFSNISNKNWRWKTYIFQLENSLKTISHAVLLLVDTVMREQEKQQQRNELWHDDWVKIYQSLGPTKITRIETTKQKRPDLNLVKWRNARKVRNGISHCEYRKDETARFIPIDPQTKILVDLKHSWIGIQLCHFSVIFNILSLWFQIFPKR